MLLLVSKLLAALPLPAIHIIGKAVGWLMHIFSPTVAKIQRNNLQSSCLSRNKSEFKRIINANIGETGKAILETLALWQWPQEKVLAHVTHWHRWDLVEEALSHGRGLIFLTPHLGCFEITSLYYGSRHPVTVLFRPPKKSWLARLIDTGRTKGQVKLAPANAQGVRALMQALKRNEAIGILPDQIPSEGEGDWADFFGKPAYTMTLACKLAEKTGAPILMVFGERLPNGKGFEIHVTPVASIATPTLLNQAIEQQIKQKPEQYLWRYNRYKTRRHALNKANKSNTED
jgi:KDO2-lipid IV(A) lauroyltransferase